MAAKVVAGEASYIAMRIHDGLPLEVNDELYRDFQALMALGLTEKRCKD